MSKSIKDFVPDAQETVNKILARVAERKSKTVESKGA